MAPFDPGKLLRMIDRLAPSLPEVAKSAIENGLKGRFAKTRTSATAPDADPRWSCIAPPSVLPDLASLMGRRSGARHTAADKAAGPEAAAMSRHVATTPTGQQPYRLFQPPGGVVPNGLIVMLHGCTQNPEDFAAGTAMNALAARHGMLVAYPEQSASANMQRCWNWFDPKNQKRGSGEPAAIAAVIAEVSAAHSIPPGRVLVAGLSAGGAMAAIMADAYPELLGAVGIHSGLPTGAARDVGSAFAAMRGTAGGGGVDGPLGAGVPTIVFHGDADATVHPGNADTIVARITARHHGLRATTEEGRAPGGRAYHRTLGRNAAGQVRFESWTVHGAGHAWSGGSAAGSYTDPQGPDASTAMMAFFLDTIGACRAEAAA